MKHRIKFLSTAATLSIIFRFVWLKLCSIHFESVYLFFYCFLLFIDMERSIWDFSTSVAIGQTKLQTKKTMYFAKFAKSDSECNLFGSIFYALRIVVDEWNRHGTTAQLRTANLNVKRCFDSIRHIPCTTLEKFFSFFRAVSALCCILTLQQHQMKRKKNRTLFMANYWFLFSRSFEILPSFDRRE